MPLAGQQRLSASMSWWCPNRCTVRCQQKPAGQCEDGEEDERGVALTSPFVRTFAAPTGSEVGDLQNHVVLSRPESAFGVNSVCGQLQAGQIRYPVCDSTRGARATRRRASSAVSPSSLGTTRRKGCRCAVGAQLEGAVHLRGEAALCGLHQPAVIVWELGAGLRNSQDCVDVEKSRRDGIGE